MKPENIELSKDELKTLHSQLLSSGLAYEYAGGVLHLIPPEAKVIGSHRLGVSAQRVCDIQAAHKQWLTVAHSTLATEEGRNLVGSLLSKEDQQRVELCHYDPNKPLYADNGYITSANLTRIDHLYDGEGEILGCDPNLVPMGMAYAHAYVSALGQMIGEDKPTGNITLYERRLAEAALKTPDKISGIVTSTKYPLYRMHLYMTNVARNRYGAPVYLIPPEAVDPKAGCIDKSMVEDVYSKLGMEAPKMPSDCQAGVLIRYCRELGQIQNPEVQVVNPSGLRTMESQLWNGLINLPGFDSYYKRLTGQSIDLDLHRRTYIRSSLAQVGLFDVGIASGIDDQGRISYDPDITKLPGFEKLLETRGTRPYYKGVLKSFSTSGNKGVRKIGERVNGLAPSTKQAYESIYGYSPSEKGQVMLIQPFVASVSELYENGGQQSHRVDVYLSGTDHALVGLALCNTPYPEKAHGGSNATYGLVYDTGKVYPDYDPKQVVTIDPDKQSLGGDHIMQALDIKAGALVGVLLSQLKARGLAEGESYSRSRQLDILSQLKDKITEAGITITPKPNQEMFNRVKELLNELYQ